MLVLEIHHNKTFIKGADSKDLELVREALTVFKQKYQLSQFQETEWEVTYLLSYRDYSFPTAYLGEVLKFCEKMNIGVHQTDVRKYPGQKLSKLIGKLNLSLRQDQQEAYDAIKAHDRGIIMMPTASGKSRVIAKTIDYRKVRTLVIVPKQNLQDQLTELLQKNFGKSKVAFQMPMELKEKIKFGALEHDEESVNNPIKKTKFSLDMDVVDSVESIKKPKITLEEMDLKSTKKKFSLDMDALGDKNLGEAPEKKYLKDKQQKRWEKAKEKRKEQWAKSPYERLKEIKIKYRDIYVFCDASLDKLPQEFLNQFDMVIVDECHNSSAKRIRDNLLRMKNAAYRYYFSATPWRDHAADEKLLAAAIGTDIIYELSPEDAIANESIAKPVFNQRRSPECLNWLQDKKKWREILELGIIGNEKRNAMIVSDAIKDYESEENVFIAVDEISHIEILKQRFKQQGIDVDVIHSEMPRSEKNEIIKRVGTKESGICIGTMSVGEGTDMPNISSVILASGGKSSIRFLQRIGRGARKGTDQSKVSFKVTDYFDWFHPTLARHSMKRKAIFDEYFKFYTE